MSYCDWDILLDGMEWQTIQDFCKKPTVKDRYYKVVKAFKEYLGGICREMQRGGHTIRHMMLEEVK
jgi:hypothetical protein